MHQTSPVVGQTHLPASVTFRVRTRWSDYGRSSGSDHPRRRPIPPLRTFDGDVPGTGGLRWGAAPDRDLPRLGDGNHQAVMIARPPLRNFIQGSLAPRNAHAVRFPGTKRAARLIPRHAHDQPTAPQQRPDHVHFDIQRLSVVGQAAVLDEVPLVEDLEFELRVVDRETKPVCGLPEVAVDESRDGGISIVLPIEITYDTLSTFLNDRVGGKSFSSDGFSVTFESLEVGP